MTMVSAGAVSYNTTTRAFHVNGTDTVIPRSDPNYSWYWGYYGHVAAPYQKQRIASINRRQESIELMPRAPRYSAAGQPVPASPVADSTDSVFGEAVLS